MMSAISLKLLFFTEHTENTYSIKTKVTNTIILTGIINVNLTFIEYLLHLGLAGIERFYVLTKCILK